MILFQGHIPSEFQTHHQFSPNPFGSLFREKRGNHGHGGHYQAHRPGYVQQPRAQPTYQAPHPQPAPQPTYHAPQPQQCSKKTIF